MQGGGGANKTLIAPLEIWAAGHEDVRSTDIRETT